MPATPSRRLPLAAAVLLLALLQPGTAIASPWSALWTWLTAWTPWGWTAATPTSDQEPDIDPNGNPASATGRSDLGPLIDPNGRPLATPTSDLGSSIDPDGGAH